MIGTDPAVQAKSFRGRGTSVRDRAPTIILVGDSTDAAVFGTDPQKARLRPHSWLLRHVRGPGAGWMDTTIWKAQEPESMARSTIRNSLSYRRGTHERNVSSLDGQHESDRRKTDMNSECSQPSGWSEGLAGESTI